MHRCRCGPADQILAMHDKVHCWKMSLLRRTCTWYKGANVSPLDKQLSTFHQPTTFSAHVHLSKRQARRHSTVQNIPCEIPPSKLNTKSHRLGWEKIQTQVEPYFTTNWKFAGEKEKQGLLAVGLSRAFSNAFPLTLDNRIGVTCKMLYLSLLIDGWYTSVLSLGRSLTNK